jgi:hypothetical protein
MLSCLFLRFVHTIIIAFFEGVGKREPRPARRLINFQHKPCDYAN